MRIEDAVTLRAVDALNQKLLASEQALRFGSADRALGECRRRSNESSRNENKAREDNANCL
jgi:hypothetical protein